MPKKVGKPCYRPITLNSCICKTLECIISGRLNNYLEAKGLVNEFQGAFRQGRGTHDQIFRVYNSAKLNSREGKATAAVFLDIAQAFDSVWHKGLKYKLANLPPPVCRLLSIWTIGIFRSYRNHVSPFLFSPNAGVPQGGVLSPTLYSFFTSDYP